MAIHGKGSISRIRNGIDDRSSFVAANVKGLTWFKTEDMPKVGMLPREWAAVLAADLRRGDVYVVLSYATPIAWLASDDKVWRMPADRYSPTTAGHQSRVMFAIGEARETLSNDIPVSA